jgi:hypothetical protein
MENRESWARGSCVSGWVDVGAEWAAHRRKERKKRTRSAWVDVADLAQKPVLFRKKASKISVYFPKCKSF